MLVELKYVEIDIEIEEVFGQAIRDGDLTIGDAVSICEDESDAEEILDLISDEDIQQYCDTKGIELECDFEMMTKNLKGLSTEERASLLWHLLGINNEDTQEEIKKVITVEIVIPKLNDLINLKRNNENE